MEQDAGERGKKYSNRTGWQLSKYYNLTEMVLLGLVRKKYQRNKQRWVKETRRNCRFTPHLTFNKLLLQNGGTRFCLCGSMQPKIIWEREGKRSLKISGWLQYLDRSYLFSFNFWATVFTSLSNECDLLVLLDEKRIVKTGSQCAVTWRRPQGRSGV